MSTVRLVLSDLQLQMAVKALECSYFILPPSSIHDMLAVPMVELGKGMFKVWHQKMLEGKGAGQVRYRVQIKASKAATLYYFLSISAMGEHPLSEGLKYDILTQLTRK